MIRKRMAASGTISLAGIVLAWHRTATGLHPIGPPRLSLRAPFTWGASESDSLELATVHTIKLAYAIGPLDAPLIIPCGDKPRY